MAKLKDLIKENFSVVGGVVTTQVIGSGTNTGLTDIVEDMYGKSERVSAHEVKEAISQFTKYSETFQQEENLKKIAESLADIANKAKTGLLGFAESNGEQIHTPVQADRWMDREIAWVQLSQRERGERACCKGWHSSSHICVILC